MTRPETSLRYGCLALCALPMLAAWAWADLLEWRKKR